MKSFLKKYKMYLLCFILLSILIIAMSQFKFISFKRFSPNSAASHQIKNAYTAAWEFFQKNPNSVFDYNALVKYMGFQDSEVGIIILDGSKEKLTILALHKKGSAVYAIRKDGSIYKYAWQYIDKEYEFPNNKK